MSLDELLSQIDTNLLLSLAINSGLVILLFWFLILYLMLRELRKFTVQIRTKELDDDERRKHQESFENAIKDAKNNNETLNALVQVHKALENQLSSIQSSSAPRSEQELEAIDDLNNKLNKSHQLIKKLKNDLNSSVGKLRKAKGILLEKDDTVESLRQQKEDIEKQFEHLEKEYIMISENGGVLESREEFRKEKQKLQATIDDYKRQLSAQPGSGSTDSDSAELKQKLIAMQKQIQHQAKEKEFIEKKYLELVNSSSEKE